MRVQAIPTTVAAVNWDSSLHNLTISSGSGHVHERGDPRIFKKKKNNNNNNDNRDNNNNNNNNSNNDKDMTHVTVLSHVFAIYTNECFRLIANNYLLLKPADNNSLAPAVWASIIRPARPERPGSHQTI
ncbi:hypothetical protein PoB_005188300 [Plakobranchus ocellatus]|uniref:Uncharacterized protein n=1 Tax=Plakobranchus ocellatus TaxID=259542 RepID=A0AAV4C311_9GAST|nr:hypothetical protein PoB_005188300 [Plakobranchus ocellatus]